MDRVRIGIIGLGWFGETHCDVLATSAEFELAADRLACLAFEQLRQTPDLQWANIPDGYLCAPVLFFEMLRTHAIMQPAPVKANEQRSQVYPAPIARRRQARAFLPMASEMDIGLHRDLRRSFSRFNIKMLRSKPETGTQ